MFQFPTSRRLAKPLLIAAGLSLALSLQGCLATAVVGTAVGVTGAVVGTTAKVGGAAVGVATGGNHKHKHKKKHRDDD
jgi:hypothetical protein